MSAESGSWSIDLHCHVSDADPSGDAPRNNPQSMLPRWRQLLDTGTVNAVSLLCHDDFPDKSVTATSEEFSGVHVLVGNEVSARIPQGMRDLARRVIRPMAHVIGIFEEKPRRWPFPSVHWPKSYRQRLSYMDSNNLPPIDEVFSAIQDNDGVLIIPHPSAVVTRPWSSLSLKEIALLRKNQVLTGEGIEINAHYLYRPTNGSVERFAKKNDEPIVGGSDAHTPAQIAKYTTVFPRLSDDAFDDLKAALVQKTTEVQRNTLVTVFDINTHITQQNRLKESLQ